MERSIELSRVNKVSCQIFQTVKNSSSSIWPCLHSFAPSTRVGIFLKTKMFFLRLINGTVFGHESAGFRKQSPLQSGALLKHCVGEFIHHTVIALYFACSFRNAIFPAFLFGRRAKTTQSCYIWTRFFYLNILIRVDRAFDSLSHSFCFQYLLVKNCILFIKQDCWTEGKAGRNITVERISELPELYERPRFGQMGASQHFGERYSQGRDVYQRYGPGQFASKGYGGKESFRRDFRPNRFPEGKNRDHVMNQHRKNISQKFDDWLDWRNCFLDSVF